MLPVAPRMLSLASLSLPTQHYPPVDVQVLLSKATELKEGGVTPGDVSPQEESSWPPEEQDSDASR